MEETKVIYYVDDEETPYLMKVPTAPEKVTLGDFKAQLNRVYHKFFFKSMDDDFGVVKEEVADDSALLPSANGRVVCWVVTGDNSASGLDIGAAKGETTSMRAKGEDEMSVASGVSRSTTRSHRHHKHHRHHRHHTKGRLSNGQSDMESCTDIASATDLDATSFCDTEDTQSRVSASTLTSLQPRKKVLTKTRPKIPRSTSCSTMTSSSVTEGSMQIITVVLNMDSVSFLGISIVGQTSDDGAGGIYVGSVMKGGAVAVDGRIEPGDMLLEVNGISFEKMSNDDAVRTLREIVQQPGPITLTVAKCFDSEQAMPQFEPRLEPIHPIDPSAWVMQANPGYSRPFTGSPTLSTMTSVSSPSLVSSMPECDTAPSKLTLTTPMYRIAKALACPTSGLEVKDRIWLKIAIPKSFIGSDLVDWLNVNVEGFIDRRHARKYAALMLKHGFIRHTVNKITFSEQCYYVFGDFKVAANSLPAEFSNLQLSDSGDGDTLGPLPSSQWGSSEGENSIAQLDYYSCANRPTAASNSSHSSKSNSPSPVPGHHSPAGSGTSGSSSQHRNRSTSVNSNGNNGSSNGVAEPPISHIKHSVSISSSSGFSSVSHQLSSHPDRHSIHSSRNSALGIPPHLGQSRESFLQALDNPIEEHYIDVM